MLGRGIHGRGFGGWAKAPEWCEGGSKTAQKGEGWGVFSRGAGRREVVPCRALTKVGRWGAGCWVSTEEMRPDEWRRVVGSDWGPWWESEPGGPRKSLPGQQGDPKSFPRGTQGILHALWLFFTLIF